MKRHILNLAFAMILPVGFWFVSCSSGVLPEPDINLPDTITAYPESYRDKIRTQPYPKSDNELMMNPAPLIVPQSMKTDARLQFALSCTDGFATDDTFVSESIEWNMYNLHRSLTPGIYYWRFRSMTSDGSPSGEWSKTYSFEVKAQTPVFITPRFETFRENLPTRYPRLYCFLDEQIDAARTNVTRHAEYKQLLARAAAPLATDYTTFDAPYRNSSTLRQHATYLYQAYHLLQKEEYGAKLYELLALLTGTPPDDSELFHENFTTTNIAFCHAVAYDQLYERLTPAERLATEEQMLRVVRYFYKSNRGFQENHIFDNHFWQQNIRILFQVLLLLHDHPVYQDEISRMMEYYYELWTARAPAGGFNRDGMWHNGTGYFTANVKTLFYMPALLSYIARTDFLQHPWYRNAGQALSYSYPPSSKSNGFGDNSEKGDLPNRLTVAFADYLAREAGDPYAGWYAGESANLLYQDYELRLYRMCADRSYGVAFPTDAPKLVWYRDIGEVAVHSNLENPENDLALSFRSSTFGSGSHTTASQNAFNLLFRGTSVYSSSGYYQNFADAHNLMSYRHSRAHNTILVNGIGQPYSTKGYGNIVRAMGGNHISYALGDASQAYSGITDDPMWINYFEQAGIGQTPENGFGITPLKKYRRHILMLHPDIVVTYDELEASEPVRWDWLLHSPAELHLNLLDRTVTSSDPKKGFVAVTRFFSGNPIEKTRTDRFTVPPAITGTGYPDQWHLTVGQNDCSSTRILSITQVKNAGEQIATVQQDGDTFRIGEWILTAELDSDRKASLRVRHHTEPVVFGYGADSLPVGESSYTPRYGDSSVLYDETTGIYGVTESIDRTAISTRIHSR